MGAMAMARVLVFFLIVASLCDLLLISTGESVRASERTLLLYAAESRLDQKRGYSKEAAITFEAGGSIRVNPAWLLVDLEIDGQRQAITGRCQREK